MKLRIHLCLMDENDNIRVENTGTLQCVNKMTYIKATTVVLRWVHGKLQGMLVRSRHK